MASAKFVWRSSLPHVLQRTLSDATRTDVQRRAKNVRDQARANLRARTKRPSGSQSIGLASTIRFATRETAGGAEAQVGSDDIRAKWVEEGTGIYGPLGHYIVPRRRQFMVFASYTPSYRHPGSIIVFAQRTKGQPGKHFLRDAARAARD